jgi:hypothetical protein
MSAFTRTVFPFFIVSLRRAFLLGIIPAIFLFLSSGCKRDDAPPPAVSVEQLPAALEKVFVKNAPEALSSLLAALREKDYSKALLGLQTISASSGLNRQQVNVVAAGLVSVNNALQEAQSQGDTNAAQTLQSYRATK